jgi:hypothetical protein
MANLNLLYLVCNDTQEWPRDELYMKVDGREVWSKGTDFFSESVGVGDTPSINKAVPIYGDSATIRLYEDDSWPNNDEKLGTHTVYSSQVGPDMQSASFTQNGADYTLYYVVSA